MVFPFAVALPAIITIGGAKVYDNYSQSSENADQQKSRNQDANNEFGNDKQVISTERSMLQGRFDGQYAGQKVTNHEDFDQWSHQDIWDALQGNNGKPAVKASDINSGANGWRRLDEGEGGNGGMREAVSTFRKEVDRAIQDHWQGKSATAAMESTRAYGTEAEKLALTFEMVANSIDLLETALGHAKTAVGEPEDVSAFDKAVAMIPGTGLLKTAKYRADESSKAAQEVMKTVYQPVAKDVDEHTPVLAPAVSTFNSDTTDPGGDKPNSKGTDDPSDTDKPKTTTTPETPTTPSGTDPEDTDPDDTDDTDDPEDTETETPETTDPDTTTPAGTTPDTTTPAGVTPSTPGGGSPLGTGGNPGGGSPGGTPSGTPAGTPVAGVPGQPAGTGAAARGGAGTSSGRNGMPGMGGMGAGGARGKGDDDSEHKIPDYLIQDRETELLGVQPRVLPPGGVIGE